MRTKCMVRPNVLGVVVGALILALLAADALVIARNPLPEAFNVVWNVPAHHCQLSNPFNLTSFQVLTNANHSWMGEEITLFYNSGKWPEIKDGKFINGGLPQLGCLSCHLKAFEAAVKQDIPDANFSGLAIIDFELWRPLFAWNWDALKCYQTASINLTRVHHPDWPDDKVKKEAEKEFNAAARSFFEQTVQRGRRLRPHAKWGFYQFPYCAFNGTGCSLPMLAENDNMVWLWSVVDVLFPEIYQPLHVSDAALHNWTRQVGARVQEAIRLAAKASPTPKRVLPYGNLWTHHRLPNGSLSPQLLSPNFLHVQVKTVQETGADGVVIWGSSSFVDTPDKCRTLSNYVIETFGPLANATITTARECRASTCSSHGRCTPYKPPLPDPPLPIRSASYLVGNRTGQEPLYGRRHHGTTDKSAIIAMRNAEEQRHTNSVQASPSWLKDLLAYWSVEHRPVLRAHAAAIWRDTQVLSNHTHVCRCDPGWSGQHCQSRSTSEV